MKSHTDHPGADAGEVGGSSSEFRFSDDEFMVTRTDAETEISYVNPAFARISGYPVEELHGSASSILYHPDMPPQFSDDLWKTLKANGAWSGLIKHLRKNGQYFWVVATITPTNIRGSHLGYTTVRTRPTAAQIDLAEHAYPHMKAGGRRFTIRDGRVARTGPLGLLQRIGAMTVEEKFRLAGLQLLASIAALSTSLAVDRSSVLRTVVVVAGYIALAGLLVTGVSLHRAITEQVRSALDLCRRLSAGDLTSAPPLVEPVDEMGKLVFSLSVTQRSLLNTVREAYAEVETVSAGSREIAAANSDLSARTERQAAALEETAATMEQLTSTVQANAISAKQASALADAASTTATRGRAVIANVHETMARISGGADKVSGISAVIESIAFQTNILALNAAVEAARAGDGGKGFAVVAAEVRSLAQRSAAAAREIKELIVESVQETQKGTEGVALAGQTMREIVSSVQSLSAFIQEISAASEEQSRGIAQVGSAVSQIDETTQHNAAMVEEAAATAASLQEKSQRLAMTMSAFHV
jgi:aerotaxis receptor